MTDQPKIIEHPGAGRIQEMTLDQYMEALPGDHYARKQLAELRSLALDAMKATQELLKALQKNQELQEKIGLYEKSTGHVPGSPIGDELSLPRAKAQLSEAVAKAADLAIEAGIAPSPPESPHKCSVCGKVTGSAAGLKAHLRFKHAMDCKIQKGTVIKTP